MNTVDNTVTLWLERPLSNTQVRRYNSYAHVDENMGVTSWAPTMVNAHESTWMTVLAKRLRCKCNHRVYDEEELAAKIKKHRPKSIRCGLVMLT